MLAGKHGNNPCATWLLQTCAIIINTALHKHLIIFSKLMYYRIVYFYYYWNIKQTNWDFVNTAELDFDLELLFFCCFSAIFSFYRESFRKLFIIGQIVCNKIQFLVEHIDPEFSLNVIFLKLIWICWNSVNGKYDKKKSVL